MAYNPIDVKVVLYKRGRWFFQTRRVRVLRFQTAPGEMPMAAAVSIVEHYARPSQVFIKYEGEVGEEGVVYQTFTVVVK